MAIGLKIRNNGNIIVADHTYKNLTLRQKTRLVQNTANVRREYRLVFTVNCSRTGVVAFRSLGGWAGVIWYNQISETQKQIELSSYAPISLDIYVFDNPVDAFRQGAVGLRIRNPATGEWTFDSRCRYMKIMGYANGTEFTETVYQGGSRLPAAIPVQNYRRDYSGSFDTGSGSVSETSGHNLQMLCSGNNIRLLIDEWTYSSGGAGGGGFNGNRQSGTPLVMFVDVTGY